MRHILYTILLFALLAGTGWMTFRSDGEESNQPEAGTIVQPALPQGKIVWHWEDTFSDAEKAKLRQWLNRVYSVTEATLGRYPFDIHFHLFRMDSGKEPVPWANTVRGEVQGVNFHVNTEFELEDFLADWTAPHEISHLSLPFVGSDNMWYSEGYATFMQYQILANQGEYTQAEIEAKYRERIAECKDNFQHNEPLPWVADSLLSKHEYPDLYWGGVSYFWKLDKALQKKHNITLAQLVQQYETCCRVNYSKPITVAKVWDKILNDNLATKLLHDYRTQPARVWFE